MGQNGTILITNCDQLLLSVIALIKYIAILCLCFDKKVVVRIITIGEKVFASDLKYPDTTYIMKYTLLFAAFALAPILTSAHTRWFTEGALPQFESAEPTIFFLTLLSLIGLVLLTISIFLHQRNIFSLSFLKPKKPHAYARAAATFAMVTGSFLLIAGTHEYLFSPNLTSETGIPNFLIFIQIAIGLSFLLGILTRVSAIVLGILWLTTFYYVGWVAALEDIWVLSTAAFIAVMGNDYFSIISFSFLRDKLQKYKYYALSFLRIGTGTTLIVLGLSEKIMAPEFGINFLNQHSWNFMQMLGFNYSDYLFTLSAGSIEIILGLIFVLGVITRLNALIVAIIFSIPLFILGPIELAGHLPHFASVVLLLLFGNGGHFTPFKIYKDTKLDPT